MKKKVNLETLAKMAGVGVATVDRVLNERGGVSHETTRLVLNAAREAGIRRILPDEHRNPWQIEVILSSNGTYFFQKLAEEFSVLANGLGYRRLTLHRTLISESQPLKLAQHIIASTKMNKRNGFIIFAPNHPAIYQALTACKARGIPVITLASDLPEADRLCHVGINQRQAGRTAGLLMSKMLPTQGDLLMVSGRADLLAHQDRIDGFKAVITKNNPLIRQTDVIVGEDDSEKLRRSLEKSLSQSKNVVGIYNTGDVNTEVSNGLARHKLAGKCLYITHEIYDLTRRLLQENILSFTLDQNAKQHAQLSLEILLRTLETSFQPDIYHDGKVEFKIVTSENID
ncbi:LacI family DNA-binding transcriptional regulator [Rouxiella sp. T17]|uniref:LacI family DNA-binding transcriptional regulator n=1 Tax=Rouxiella sp. T17 TaxID=3085684 RepID=UPI002FC92A7A